MNNLRTKIISLNNATISLISQVRFASKHKVAKPRNNKRPPQPPILNAVSTTLKMKGYLRNQDPYTPPENVKEQVEHLLENFPDLSSQLSKNSKAEFLKLCSEQFGRSVPNSALHEIISIDDVISFYNEPVNSYLPLDEMTRRPLPPNLHIQQDYVRFTKETSSFFGGHTAFPKSSTIVTGLKYRNKYPGYEAKRKWP